MMSVNSYKPQDRQATGVMSILPVRKLKFRKCR
jgi:hypothetical protein